MTDLLRKATPLAAAGVLLASTAMAAALDGANSTAPALIPLATRDALNNKDNVLFGVQPPTFTVIVRDLANNPIPNASVVVDISGSIDLQICNDQLHVAALFNDAANTIRMVTAATRAVA